MYCMLVLAVIVRCTLTDDRDFMWARNAYALDLAMFYLRILQIFLIHQHIGLIIVMIGRMVCTVGACYFWCYA